MERLGFRGTVREFFDSLQGDGRFYSNDTVNFIYYIPITDTTFELSVFWPSDTESQSTN